MYIIYLSINIEATLKQKKKETKKRAAERMGHPKIILEKKGGRGRMERGKGIGNRKEGCLGLAAWNVKVGGRLESREQAKLFPGS